MKGSVQNTDKNSQLTIASLDPKGLQEYTDKDSRPGGLGPNSQTARQPDT